MKRRKYNITKNQLEYYIHCKRTVEDISKMLNIIPATVRRYLNDFSLEEYRECKYCHTDNEDDLIFLTQWGEKRIVNVCENCFGNKVSNTKTGNLITKEFLYNEYITKGRSLYDIKNELQCRQRTLLRYLKLYGFKEAYKCIRCGSTNNLVPKIGKDVFKYQKYCKQCINSIQRETLKNKYLKKLENKDIDIHEVAELNKTEPLLKLCKRLHINYNFIKRAFKENNIEENKFCALCGSKEDLFVSNHKYVKGVIKCICNTCMAKKFNNVHHNYSFISQELFDSIYRELPKELQDLCRYQILNKEKSDYISVGDREGLQINNKKFIYDFCIDFPEYQFVIEFNGDLWHANPKFYKEDDTPNPFLKNRTAKEIWEYDSKREDFVEGNGGFFLTIWESDYKKQKKECVHYCLQQIGRFYTNLVEYYE